MTFFWNKGVIENLCPCSEVDDRFFFWITTFIVNVPFAVTLCRQFVWLIFQSFVIQYIHVEPLIRLCQIQVENCSIKG